MSLCIPENSAIEKLSIIIIIIITTVFLNDFSASSDGSRVN